MFIKSDSNLSIFISDLRKLEGREREIKALTERRSILDCNNQYHQQSNVLKMIYFVLNKQNVDVMLFVKAIGSSDPNTKKFGYLGLSLSNSEAYLILTVNTLMKDLQDKTTREIALNFLCNIHTKSRHFNELAGFICTKNSSDKLIVKSTIAKSKIRPSERISLVGNNENLIFSKIQILIDKLLEKENVDMIENDKLFLFSYYSTTSNSFLKIKLVQLYKILNERKQMNFTKSFFQCLEKDIILPHETVKPLVDISLSIEIADLFLSSSNVSQRVESFLFRLIDSQNPNSRFMGFKLAIKHNMFCNQVIDKSIKWGLHNEDCYEALMFFINKSTHKEIYKRKEEMRFTMDKQDVKDIVAKDIIRNILLRVLEYAKDEFYIKIYYENPEIIFLKEFDRNISEELKSVYFKKILHKNKIKYLYLLYALLPRDYKENDFYEELFRNHLNLILNSKSKKGALVLDCLIRTYLYFTDLDFYRDLLVENVDVASKEYKESMLDGICLMNTKCKTKVLCLMCGVILQYELSFNLLKVMLKGEVKSVEVRCCDEKALKKDVYFEKDFNVYEFELQSSRNVVLFFNTNEQKVTQPLYLQ